MLRYTTDVYARADSMAKREALEKAYENMPPKIDREWEKDKVNSTRQSTPHNIGYDKNTN